MKVASVLGVLFLAALILWAGPLLLLYALNTLFGLTLALTFDTWLASVILILLFSR